MVGDLKKYRVECCKEHRKNDQKKNVAKGANSALQYRNNVSVLTKTDLLTQRLQVGAAIPNDTINILDE